MNKAIHRGIGGLGNLGADSSNLRLGTGTVPPPTGSDNVILGYQALTLADASYAVIIGSGAVQNGSLISNPQAIAIGYQAMQNARDGSTVAIGYQAAKNLTSGSQNVVIGYQAAQALTSASQSIAIGYQALFSSTNNGGNGANVAVGYLALNASTSGGSNVAVGNNAMSNASGGSQCVAIGHLAMSSSGILGDATGVGYRALSGGTGQYNTAIGSAAGYQPNGVGANQTTSGAKQTLLGAYSGQGSSTARNEIICIGYAALADGNNAIAIGSGASAGAAGAVAIGKDSGGTSASTTTADEIKLGTSLSTVNCGKDLKTSQPSANGQGAWKMGKTITAASTVDTTRYVEVSIDGTVVKLAVCS